MSFFESRASSGSSMLTTPASNQLRRSARLAEAFNTLCQHNSSLLHTSGLNVDDSQSLKRPRKNAAKLMESNLSTSMPLPPSTAPAPNKAKRRKVPTKMPHSDSDGDSNKEVEDAVAARPMSASERLYGEFLSTKFPGEPLLDPAMLFKDIYVGAHLSIAGL